MPNVSDELPRCPFCGSKAEPYPDGDMEGHSIMCTGKGALFGGTAADCPMRTFGFATHEEAVAAWSRRAGASPQAAQRLLELIDRYWTLAYAEGKEGREHDTEDGAAQQTRSEIERIIRNALGAPAAWNMPAAPELLAFINATPLAQSLLYELKLLPECITDAVGWMRMAAVCEHLRQALAPAPSGLDPQIGFLLDGANAGELAAYDYGCAQSMDAVQRVLDGKDDGRGVANAPWEPLRRRLLALVASRRAVAAGQQDAPPRYKWDTDMDAMVGPAPLAPAQAAPTVSVAREHLADPSPWQVDEWRDGRVVLQSHHSEYDVALIVSGNFADHAQKLDYARRLAKQFGAFRPIPPALRRWLDPNHIRLHAGEMTPQELRTVQAVVRAVLGDFSRSAV